VTGLGQPVKFVLVGTGGYVVNLALFAALYALDVPYVAASIASYFVSNALMYLGNRYFTFGLGHAGFLGAYVRYLLVGGVVVALNAAILAALVEGAGVDPRVAQAISLLAITPVAFVLNKRWTFQLRPA
jgi:putative flippase GtrA